MNKATGTVSSLNIRSMKNYDRSSQFIPCAPFTDDECVFNDPGHPEWFLQGLNELRSNGQFCDVTLCVGDQNFPVHKNVLAAFSSYFKAMFLSNLAESQQEFITLSGVEAEMVSLLLNYAYTSTITINSGNVQNLLSASNFLEVTSVKGACCRFIERNIDNANCIGVNCFAELHACNDLARKAKGYALKNFSLVMKCEEWANLSLSKIIEFLNSDDLEVEKEEMVYQAASVWLHKDYVSRSKNFHKVLECVRLPLVSPYYITDYVEAELAVRSSPECRVLLEEAKTFHLLPDRRPNLNLKSSIPRKNSKTITGIVAVGGEDNTLVLKLVECFDPLGHSWTSLLYIPFAVSKHGVVVSGGNLMYLAGGEFVDGTITSSMWRYDPVLNDWTELAPMLLARSELGLAILDGLIYAICGWDGVNRTTTVECYDPQTNEWKKVAPCCAALMSPAVTSFQGKLYVCGGTVADCEDGIDLVQVYNPIEDSWEQMPPLLIPRNGAVAAAVNGFIYVIGGYHAGTENTSKVEKYDPRTKEWSFVSSMKERRFQPGVAVLRDKIYVLGGEDGWEHFQKSIECYDPVTDEWTINGEMLSGRSYLACGLIKIKKNLPKSYDTIGLNRTVSLQEEDWLNFITPKALWMINNSIETEKTNAL